MDKKIVANSVKDQMFLQVFSHLTDFIHEKNLSDEIKSHIETYFNKFNTHRDFCNWILSIILIEKELLDRINSKKITGEANLRNFNDLKTYFIEKDNILNRKSDAEPYLKLLNLTYNNNKGNLSNSTIKTLMELTDRIVKINIDNHSNDDTTDFINQKLTSLQKNIIDK